MKPDRLSRIALLAILVILLLQWDNGRYQPIREEQFSVFDTRTGTHYLIPKEQGQDVAAYNLVQGIRSDFPMKKPAPWWRDRETIWITAIILLGAYLTFVAWRGSG